MLCLDFQLNYACLVTWKSLISVGSEKKLFHNVTKNQTTFQLLLEVFVKNTRIFMHPFRPETNKYKI